MSLTSRSAPTGAAYLSGLVVYSSHYLPCLASAGAAFVKGGSQQLKHPPPKNQRYDLVEQHFRSEYDHLVSYAEHLLNSPSLAEVAVQDTFVCALENYEKFQRSRNPIGWLYNTLKNIIRHIRRDQQAVLKRAVQLDDCAVLYLSTSDKYALDFSHKLADPDLQLLIQFYLYGYTIKELANRHGTSVGAMTMRIKRAKERIRKSLEP